MTDLWNDVLNHHVKKLEMGIFYWIKTGTRSPRKGFMFMFNLLLTFLIIIIDIISHIKYHQPNGSIIKCLILRISSYYSDL
jgi:hypothetical protein